MKKYLSEIVYLLKIMELESQGIPCFRRKVLDRAKLVRSNFGPNYPSFQTQNKFLGHQGCANKCTYLRILETTPMFGPPPVQQAARPESMTGNKEEERVERRARGQANTMRGREGGRERERAVKREQGAGLQKGNVFCNNHFGRGSLGVVRKQPTPRVHDQG